MGDRGDTWPCRGHRPARAGELSTHCPFLPRRDLDLCTAVPSLLSSPEKSFEQNTAHSGNSPGPVTRRPAEPTASTTVLFCSSALCKSVKGAQGREATPHTKMTRIIHFMSAPGSATCELLSSWDLRGSMQMQRATGSRTQTQWHASGTPQIMT